MLYLVLRTQAIQPFNPQGFTHSGPWDLSFNTASSFVSNTSWRYYAGETTLSDFSQMAGITVASFTSCATGMAVAAAVIRGLGRRGTDRLGNFWVDLTRSLLYVLLPIAVLAAILLVATGVPQTLEHYLNAHGPTGLSQTILAIMLILVAWVFVTCWYLIWGLWLVPYRLLRRGARKRKAEALRHRELMGTIQGSAAASAAAIAATTAGAQVAALTAPLYAPGELVGDADRDLTIEKLQDHMLAGRLNAQEFEERVDVAHRARTRGDLEAVGMNLP